MGEPHRQATAGSDPEDVRAPTPLDRLRARLGPPRSYRLTRSVILRLLGLVYLFAFLGLTQQILPLCGASGLTPIADYLDRMRDGGYGFWDAPSLFWWGSSDATLIVLAYVGVALSLIVVAGYGNMPVLLALWVIYGSYVHLGQLWFSFGWEIQLLETGFLAVFLAPPPESSAAS